jgi:hypothetical protein
MRLEGLIRRKAEANTNATRNMVPIPMVLRPAPRTGATWSKVLWGQAKGIYVCAARWQWPVGHGSWGSFSFSCSWELPSSCLGQLDLAAS